MEIDKVYHHIHLVSNLKVTVPGAEGHSNVVKLMNIRGGGVESLVTLTKGDMALFEGDLELLAIAYLSTQNTAV